MTIETKFEPHRLVWMMWENKAIEVEVHDMEVRVYQPSGSPVVYGVYLRVMKGGNLLAGCHSEDLFFTSKADLLASL